MQLPDGAQAQENPNPAPTPNPTPAPAPVEEEVIPTEEPEPEPTEEPEPEPEPAEEPSPSEDPVFTYNGQEVELEVPEDLNQMFTDKGLDLQAVTAELYSGDEFGLSDETKEALYAQFGKFSVDSYLSGLKAQNDLSMSRFEQDAKAVETAAAEAWEQTLGIVGDEAGWNSLMDYADENLTDQDRDDWNEIMESNNWTMQRLAIQDLANRAGIKAESAPSSLHPAQANGSMVGDSLELAEANGGDSRGTGDTGALSRAEYQKLWSASLPAAERDALDARRRAGIQKGL